MQTSQKLTKVLPSFNQNGVRHKPDFFLKLIHADATVLSRVPMEYKTKEFYETAVLRNPRALMLVPKQNQTIGMCTDAILNCPEMVQHAQSIVHFCVSEIKANPDVLQFIPDSLKDVVNEAIQQKQRLLNSLSPTLATTNIRVLKSKKTHHAGLLQLKNKIKQA